MTWGWEHLVLFAVVLLGVLVIVHATRGGATPVSRVDDEERQGLDTRGPDDR